MKGLKQLQRGFTLMELMVVIVIVAILAAVAVPLYINYVNDARLTEAKGAIGAIVTAEQTFYQQYNRYTPDAWPGTAHSLNCDLSQTTANWKFDVTTPSDSEFVATATGRDSSEYKDLKAVYTYNHSTGGKFN
jgi:prepilin-type N-terminal cleavage/methylation domain-containing protein